MTREPHVHSCRTGKNKVVLVSTLVFSPFLFSLLLLSNLLYPPTLHSWTFLSQYLKPTPVIKDTLSFLSSRMPFLSTSQFMLSCIHSIHLDARFEYSLPYGWTDGQFEGLTTGQAILHFSPLVFNKFIQVTELPHIELICGYKLWSLPFFQPPLNLKSINWWLWLEVLMPSLVFFS